MEIGQVGVQLSTVKQINYTSDYSLLEYDMIIIDCQFLKVMLNKQDSSLLKRFKKRHSELTEFLTHKSIPIVYLNIPDNPFQYWEFGRSYNINMQEIFPIPPFNRYAEIGSKIEIIPKTSFVDFLNKYKSYFSYDFYFSDIKNVTTICETVITKKCLGFYDSNSVVLPKIHNLGEAEFDFIIELYNLLSNKLTENSEESVPSWVTGYKLPNELEISSRIDNLRQQITDLEKQAIEADSIQLQYNKAKRIFYSSGNLLEKEVEEIFIALGFEIIDSANNRDDLIVKHEDRIAVIEIKGVKKSAAEKHAAQLEKWVATYIEEKGLKPKPILIVNTFNETPLQERTETSFPDQMLTYSIRRDHCLITTLQLMQLSYNAKESEEIKKKLIDSLFSTVGEYPDFKDWSIFISKI